MIVYHGTGDYALKDIQAKGLRRERYPHVLHPCASVTTNIEIAQLFATRRSSSEDFLAGRLSGIVIEFELQGREGRDYAKVRDARSLHEESEIAVYSTQMLRLLAVHRHKDGNWIREAV